MIRGWKESTTAGVSHPEGFRTSATRAGLKATGDDVALIASDQPAAVAGTFTRNLVQASCVLYSRTIARSGRAQAIVVNAGNANACNGGQGDRDTLMMADVAGECLEVDPRLVLVASTGVIGQPLPMALVTKGIRQAAGHLTRGARADQRTAKAIMTTDLRPKQIAVTYRSTAHAGEVRIGGVCKGSGMIAPNMATMLCFITTDALVAPEHLQQALSQAVDVTFNRVTVDGDTSTNDMCLALANGVSGVEIAPGEPLDDFAAALKRVCRYLAREVARDGEGATKLIEVTVRGASAQETADRMARVIAESPLVKTAMFGCDPNWGRILAAAGRAGVPFEPECAEVLLGDICVYRRGLGAPFDAGAATEYLRSREIAITLNLNSGVHECTVWTCDFSFDYVRINAEYHT